MYYLSTRDKTIRQTAAQAIIQGLAADGGLMTPSEFPSLRPEELKSMKNMSYQERAVLVMSRYLEDFTRSELETFSDRAYGRFDTPEVAPLRHVDGGTWCMELWHGPTCAFKDMALQMLPHLLTASMEKNGEKRTACILVATSGDTGKAALEGFRDVDRTRILVFYPRDGVSRIQKLQMVTQEGDNVDVCAVEGNFDDAQTGVKHLFSDDKLRAELNSRGFFFSSANSINWGRVLPQIVYYVSAYCQLCSEGVVSEGGQINVCVPTGNFGNILAAYYAKKMGVPIGKLICASNSNNVLTEFLHTGTYDRNRKFYQTISPSMDILVSSNLERLLFDLSGEDDALVRGYMARLSRDGSYTVTREMKDKLEEIFAAGFCDEDQTRECIGKMWREKQYLIDPHTAVAFHVLDEYREQTGDRAPTVVASTASPYKFCGSVLQALGEINTDGGTELIDRLERLTGTQAPRPLAELKDKKVRFTECVSAGDMAEAIMEILR